MYIFMQDDIQVWTYYIQLMKQLGNYLIWKMFFFGGGGRREGDDRDGTQDLHMPGKPFTTKPHLQPWKMLISHCFCTLGFGP